MPTFVFLNVSLASVFKIDNKSGFMLEGPIQKEFARMWERPMVTAAGEAPWQHLWSWMEEHSDCNSSLFYMLTYLFM